MIPSVAPVVRKAVVVVVVVQTAVVVAVSVDLVVVAAVSVDLVAVAAGILVVEEPVPQVEGNESSVEDTEYNPSESW